MSRSHVTGGARHSERLYMDGATIRKGTSTTTMHILGWIAEGRPVYGYFNNDYNGHAVRDAEYLK